MERVGIQGDRGKYTNPRNASIRVVFVSCEGGESSERTTDRHEVFARFWRPAARDQCRFEQKVGTLPTWPIDTALSTLQHPNTVSTAQRRPLQRRITHFSSERTEKKGEMTFCFLHMSRAVSPTPSGSSSTEGFDFMEVGQSLLSIERELTLHF